MIVPFRTIIMFKFRKLLDTLTEHGLRVTIVTNNHSDHFQPEDYECDTKMFKFRHFYVKNIVNPPISSRQ